MTEENGARNKISMAAVSLGLSLLLWTVVKLSQPPDFKPVSTDVLLVDTEKYQDRYIFPEELDQATVLVEGPTDQVQTVDERFLKRNGVFVYADLNNLHLGKARYPLKLYQPKRNSPYTFNLLTKDVQIEIQEVRRRRLPISVEPTGEIEASRNLSYNGATADPNMVALRGPRAAVDRVKRIRVYLDLAEVRQHGEMTSPAEALDENDNIVTDVTVSPQLINLRPQLAPGGSTRTVLIEPTFKGKPAMGFSVSNWAVEPNQVALQGPQEILSTLRKVSTKEIPLEGVRTSTSYDVALMLPPGVKSYSTRTVQVQVAVEPTPATASAGNDR